MIKKLLFISFLLVFAYPSIGSTVAMEETSQSVTSSLTLTTAEADWLKAHPEITFTGDPNWLPFEAFDKHGNFIGIVSAFLHHFETTTGLRFKKIPSDTWTHAVQMAVNQQVDVISDHIGNESVHNTHTFTKPYMKHPLVVISRRSSGALIENLNDIKQEKIGVIRGYGYLWALRKRYPEVSLVEVDNIQDALSQLKSGKLDYFVSSYTLSSYHMHKMDMNDLQVRGKLPISLQVGLGVRHDWPELLSILNKAIDNMPTEERYRISENWLISNSHYLQQSQWIARTLIILGSLLTLLLIGLLLIKLHHRKLLGSETRYNNAMGAVFAGVWEFNCKTEQLYLSVPFMQRLGYEPEDVPVNFEALIDIIDVDDRHRFRYTVTQNLSSKTKAESYFEIEFRLLNANKNPVWLLAKGNTTAWDIKGNALMRSGTLENIDILKRSEQDLAQSQKALREREQLLQTLVQNIPDIIYLKDCSGTYLYCNNALTEFFGIAEQDLIGKKSADILDSKNAERIDEQDLSVVLSKKPAQYDSWLVSFDGKRRGFFETQKVPIQDGDKISGVLSISRNLTERYNLQRELEKFQQFAEHSGQGFGMVTPDSNIIYMNPTLRNLLAGPDQPPEAAYNQPLVKYYPHHVHQLLIDTVLPQVMETGFWRGELAALRFDGTQIPTLETFFLIRDKKGQPLFIGDILVDISTEKEVLLELERAKVAADKANASKSIFLANMSHEIRTPLNAVLGYSQLLMNNHSLAAEPKRQISLIHASGVRLLSLINDILDLSKIEAGKFSLNVELFDLKQEITELIHLMSDRAFNKGLKLISDLQLTEHTLVQTDKAKLGQVLLNLLSNAIKFSDRGDITLTAIRLNAGEVEIKVQDNGPGMNEQEINNLFRPFSQGRAGAKHGGTGLGLVLAKKIVEAMDGRLQFDSEENKGVTVTIYLPLTIQQGSLERLPDHVTQYPMLDPAHPLTALVVEDDVPSRDVLTQFLRDIGVTVVEAENGIEGLERAQAVIPNIIFTDIRMPLMTGTEMLKELQKLRELKDIPIVAVTASSLAHERSFYVAQGFHDFIGKPIVLTQIIQVLDRHLLPTWDEEITQTVLDKSLQNSNTNTLPEIIPTPPHSVIHITPELTNVLNKINSAAEEGDIDTVQILLRDDVFELHFQHLRELYQKRLNTYDLLTLQNDISALLKSANHQ